MRAIIVVACLAASAAFAAAPQEFQTYTPGELAAHPEWDAEYTRLIREATTGTQFMTPLVDHLTAAEGVPTPLAFNGYIAGAPDHLTYAARIHDYMRVLAAASPRVDVLSIGSTEEGREMIAVVVADEATLATLDHYREITARLADPRAIDDQTAADLIAEGKPIYYLTGGLHSPETGSPEMLMELAYRLAVEDTPLIRSIRENVITLITPVLEVDGRERMVDLWRWIAAHPDEGPPPLVYWGHYVRHDNNRDWMGEALALTRNVERFYFEWHPQVMHDLHESIPFLYVSSGTGPYNAWLDPLMVDQWERMAIHEVQALTAMGLPGVWTHGFYDGWAPGYLFWVAMGHNSLGRFYETFGNMVPTTEDRVVRGTSDRAWYRPNPPLPQVRWSLRDNVNFTQSGVLLALAWTAEHRRETLDLFFKLSRRSIAKARTEGPAAYVLTADQPRRGQLRGLLETLRRHGVEVSVAEKAFVVKDEWPPKTDAKQEDASESAGEKGKKGPAKGERGAKGKDETTADEGVLSFPEGSFVVRMDQPYSRLADALLDTQYVLGEERVYDDTGWTFGEARNVEWKRIVNPEMLDVPMRPWDGGGAALGGLRSLPERAAAVAIENHADTDLIRLRYILDDVPMRIAEEEIPGKPPLPVGTVIVEVDDATRDRVTDVLGRLNLSGRALAKLPEVAWHPLAAPRIAVVHTWTNTQDEGWFRLALEELGVPYDYLSTQDLAGAGELRQRWEVIVLPPGGDSDDLVNGFPPGPALPWEASELTPNWGLIDATDDIRPGMGFDGVAAVNRFVEEGGLLIAVGESAVWAVDYGLARYVRVVETEGLRANGSLLAAAVVDRASPVAYGYGDTVPVYFSREPVFEVGRVMRRWGADGSRPSGRGGKDDPDVPQGRPYVPIPPRPTPGPGEKGFQPPEDRAFLYKAYFPAPEDRPRVILAFPEKGGDILLSGMLDGAAKIAGKAVVVDCPRGEGHVLLFGNNPMWRSSTQGSYALIMNAIANYDHLALGRPAAVSPPRSSEP